MRQSTIYDFNKGDLLKHEGMERAEARRIESLAKARSFVKQLAAARSSKEATADDVGRWCEKHGIDLGPAAGSIFKSSDWEFTGKRVKSKRISNHSRELKVWRLKKVDNPESAVR